MWICFRKKIKSWLIYQIDSVFSVSVHALSIFCNDWSTHFQASSLKPRTFAESKVPLIDLVHIWRIECSNIKSVHSNVLFSTIFPGVTKFQTRGPYLDLTPSPLGKYVSQGQGLHLYHLGVSNVIVTAQLNLNMSWSLTW